MVRVRLGEYSEIGPIAAGADGALWFLSDEGVGRVAVGGELRFTRMTLTAGAQGSRTPGSDGTVWVTDNGHRMFRITPDGIVSRIHTLPGPENVTAGPDGNLYYSFTPDRAAGFASVAPDGSQ